jgi:integrase
MYPLCRCQLSFRSYSLGSSRRPPPRSSPAYATNGGRHEAANSSTRHGPVLSILLGRAVEFGILTSNPVRDVKQVRRPRDARVVNRAWTIEERKSALTHLAPQLRLPVAIGLYSGMRVADILRLPPTVIQSGRIQVKTAKRGIWIYLLIPAALRSALKAAPKAEGGATPLRLCLNARGLAWTESGFSCSFRKAIADLRDRGLVGGGLTFHGLRHTVASELAECEGVSAEDIAAVLGQKTSQMAEHYSREADRSRRTAATIAKYRPLRDKGGRKKANGT